MRKLTELIHGAALAAALLITSGCRPRQPDASAVLDDETGPGGVPAAFHQLCSTIAQAPQNTRVIYRAILDRAFQETGLGASAVIAQKSCPEIWAGIVARPLLQVIGPFHDLAPLTAFAQVPDAHLDLNITGMLKNFAVVKTMKLKKFGIRSAGDGEAPLTDANRAEILGVVAQMPHLTELTLDMLGYKDLSPLAGLPNLEYISFARNQVTDLTFMAGWNNLKRVQAWRNGIRKLDPLKDSLQLETLEISENRVESLEPLLLLGNLARLDMNGNTPLENILALQFLPNLSYLALENAGVKNIEPLKALPLTFLNLRGNPVETIKPLEGLPLRELFLSGTKVTDLTPATTLPELFRLVIASTPVSKIPPFPPTHKLAVIDLQGTGVTNFCPALKHPTLNFLRTPGGGILDKNKIAQQKASCP